ncbi:unnamed protein product [Discula destructiva]
MTAQNLDDYVASYAHIANSGICNNIDVNPATTTQGPITDPERRHAPTTLTPWVDGAHILDDIFLCLRMLETTDDTARANFPSRDHVDETGSELPVINSEAAVHFFDYDTIYKPAKKILDSALARSTALRASMTTILQRHHLSANTDATSQVGQVVFSPHSRTMAVPAHIIGRKRKRSRPASQALASSDSESEGRVSTESDDPEATMDEIHVSENAPDPGGSTHMRQEKAINVKSGPGDFYCSLVSNRRVTTATSSSTPPPRQLLLVGEAKAPHKLTRGLIQRALGGNITIDVRQFIQNAEPRPSLSPPHSSGSVPARSANRYSDYNVDQRWLAAVATQIYSSLLNKKLRYGYITTSESYILVRIRPEQATVLEYLRLSRLRAQSRLEVEERQPSWLSWLATTPLARLSCLALLSLFGDGQLTTTEVAQAKTTIPTMIWKTPRHREQSLGTSSFMSAASAQTKGSDPDWTEQSEQGVKRARETSGTDSDEEPGLQHQHKRACRMGDNDVGRTPYKPSSMSTLGPPLTPPPESKQRDDADDIQTVPFCSPQCLRSLQLREAHPSLTGDQTCPNWAIHIQTARVAPTATQIQELARECVTLPSYIQADCNTEEDPPVLMTRSTESAVYMGQYGASSAIFKVRVAGYVLVAKAARSIHPLEDFNVLQRLRDEETVYRRLRSLQGQGIPVCLGLVDVAHSSRGQKRSVHSSGLAHFTGFLLLGWAGSSLLDTSIHASVHRERAWLDRLRAEVRDCLSLMHGLGIMHGDAELRNLVISNTGGDGVPSVRWVDFERALSKGRFTRRLRRYRKGMDEEEVKRRFQQACQRETTLCLEQWDDWAGKQVSQ